MTSLRQFGQNTFSSLKIRNYRLYYIGQVISTSGTFMQSVAQAWLVLQLTNSGTELGLVAALQYLPILILSPFAGVLADRFSKRRLLLVTQSAFGVIAVMLGLLVATGLVQIWMVYVFAVCYGLINTLDNPTRQSFVVEMVGERELKNAVTLYSSLVNLSRVIGPSIAGILIATVGLAPCFILNGLSYAAVVIMLLVMNVHELRTPPPAPRMKGQVRAGFNYVRSTPVLRNVLLMLAIIGTLTFEFQVSLPLIAQFTFNSGAQGYAALSAAMGIGAVAGGLITAGQKNMSSHLLILAAFLFGLATLIAAIMPNLVLAILGMVIVGVFSIYFTALGNSILQIESAPQMRGRVMALWAVAFLGSTTIGGPIVGLVGETIGPRWGLGIGGIAAIAAALLGFVTVRMVQPPKRVSEAAVTSASLTAEEDTRVQ
ncbi:MAG: MFS transporter [Chloroflexi bacterium]|nr:MFS transporter [Chloroflexota bacterium]